MPILPDPFCCKVAPEVSSKDRIVEHHYEVKSLSVNSLEGMQPKGDAEDPHWRNLLRAISLFRGLLTAVRRSVAPLHDHHMTVSSLSAHARSPDGQTFLSEEDAMEGKMRAAKAAESREDERGVSTPPEEKIASLQNPVSSSSSAQGSPAPPLSSSDPSDIPKEK